MTTETGRILIVLQGAVQELEFSDDAERKHFLNDLADSLPERLRQSLLTWRANRKTNDDLVKAQEIDRARRGGNVP